MKFQTGFWVVKVVIGYKYYLSYNLLEGTLHELFNVSWWITFTREFADLKINYMRPILSLCFFNVDHTLLYLNIRISKLKNTQFNSILEFF